MRMTRPAWAGLWVKRGYSCFKIMADTFAIVSTAETSTNCPSPVRRRWARAATVSNAEAAPTLEEMARAFDKGGYPVGIELAPAPGAPLTAEVSATLARFTDVPAEPPPAPAKPAQIAIALGRSRAGNTEVKSDSVEGMMNAAKSLKANKA